MRAIAERISHELGSIEGMFLPSSRELCCTFGVSRPTLAAALRLLERRGLVRLSARRRTTIVGRSTPSPLPRARAHETLSEFIRENIRQGIYPSQLPLPKAAYFCATRGVSASTVNAALTSLAREGAAHKFRNRWVAGRQGFPAPRDDTPRVYFPASMPVIVLVEPRAGDWEGLITERTGRFVNSFTHEAQMRQVQIQPCTLDRGSRPRVTTARRAGLEAIEALIRELGDRYLGALMIGQPGSHPRFDAAVGMLVTYRRPVVWFDTKENDTAVMPHSRHFTRCCFSERAVAAAAAQFLVSMGHRSILFASSLDTAWEQTRYRLLAEETAALDRSCTVTSSAECARQLALADGAQLAVNLRRAHHAPPAYRRKTIGSVLRVLARLRAGFPDYMRNVPQYTALAQFVQRGLTQPGPLLRRIWDTVPLWNIQTLLPALLHGEFTAIAAPNDQSARLLLQEIEAYGITVPLGVSLISFDNYADYASLPVTTIDIGADSLGYAAFHAILGDIPTARRGATGDIVAVPRVVRRGSVRQLTQR